MRSLAETRSRWDATFAHNSNLSDLKASVRNKGENPCNIGLRSICWKAFLLFENLDRSTWSKTLRDSRSAYASLREHFLRDITYPDDLSAVDPLADDETSPWNTLRKDEVLREEIYQDVERCMPENLYFREPATQSTLLDILFIFCKLNADIGYRQGMHEVLAPILWVVSRDAIDPASLSKVENPDSDSDLIREALDQSYLEHDAFTIFCIIMQTVKSFYELGNNNPQPTTGASTNSPIVERSKRIHEVYLRNVDPELTEHLMDIDILPQIFVIRWIRLLFGREFPFDDVLSLWDVLFAEDPGLELIDFVCVAMLLRVRWQLMDADYSSALTLLLRYPAPPDTQGPSTFVSDALHLSKNLSLDGGSYIISKYSGRPTLNASQRTSDSYRRSRTRKPTSATPDNSMRRKSPIRSPARFLQEQGGIEGILQEAAKGVYSRGEKWGVGKALRGAVQGLQSGSSSPRRSPLAGVRWSLDDGKQVSSNDEQLTARIEALETRNKALAKMLEGAIEDLVIQEKAFAKEKEEAAANALGLAIAKTQFVQVYLEDSSMPLVSEAPAQEVDKRPKTSPEPVITIQSPLAKKVAAVLEGISSQTEPKSPGSTTSKTIEVRSDATDEPTLSSPSAIPKIEEPAPTPTPDTPVDPPPPKPKPVKEKPLPSPFHQPRPSLAQSSFSWMLGPDQRKSSFVSASPFPPEKKRESATRGKVGFLFGEEEDEGHGSGNTKAKAKEKDGDGGEGEGDVYTLGTLRGAPEGL
ncbi:hypothetical protein MMC30_001322 [Trapelia coarctata]|nr:hypothetical protein [Trapelia coarctata]